MENRLDQLEFRLARAERRLRLLAALAITVAGTSLCLWGQASSAAARSGTTLRAPVRVVDARGRTLLQVTSTYYGGGCVEIRSAAGKPHVVLNSNPWGGAVWVNDRRGASVAVLGACMLPNGGGLLKFFDGESRSLLDLWGNPARGGDLSVWHPSGAPLASLSAEGGTGTLVLGDKSGKVIFAKPDSAKLPQPVSGGSGIELPKR